MADSMVSSYWCHVCSQTVNPIFSSDIICPRCDSGFVEEIANRDNSHLYNAAGTRSSFAPFLLELLNGYSQQQRNYREEAFNNESDNVFESFPESGRISSALHRLLQNLSEISGESNNMPNERENIRDVPLINRSNQNWNSNASARTSPGDFLVGQGLDLLLHHVSENESERYGAPPAQEEAIESMPTVRIRERSSCSVCLEDIVIGSTATQMPCEHKFHTECILPWLELHSSCPVCRFQLRSVDGTRDSTVNGDVNGTEITSGSSTSNEGRSRRNGRRNRSSLPWPFNMFPV